MKAKLIIGIIILLALIAGVFFFLKRPQTTTPPVQTNTGTAPATQASNTITISNFTFNPDILAVKVGTTVTWVNQDNIEHTINSDDFSSTNLKNGDKFEFTFSKKGIFDYFCSIHPAMRGQIIVE